MSAGGNPLATLEMMMMQQTQLLRTIAGKLPIVAGSTTEYGGAMIPLGGSARSESTEVLEAILHTLEQIHQKIGSGEGKQEESESRPSRTSGAMNQLSRWVSNLFGLEKKRSVEDEKKGEEKTDKPKEETPEERAKRLMSSLRAPVYTQRGVWEQTGPVDPATGEQGWEEKNLLASRHAYVKHPDLEKPTPVPIEKPITPPTDDASTTFGDVAKLAHLFGAGETAGKMGKAANMASAAETMAAGGSPLGMVGMIVKAVQEKIGHGKAMVGEGMEAVASQRFGDIGAHMGKSIQHAGEMTGIPGMKEVGQFVTVIGESIEKLRRWNEVLHEGNMRFAEFSGAMSAVQARQEVRDILLSQRRGERRARAAEMLAESKSHLEKALAPFEDRWAELQAGVFSAVNENLAKILIILQRITGIIDKPEGEIDNVDKWLEDVVNKFGRPRGM